MLKNKQLIYTKKCSIYIKLPRLSVRGCLTSRFLTNVQTDFHETFQRS